MVTVRLVLCPSCVTQGVPDDKQEGSGGDGCGGNAQREEGEAYESFDAGSHYISHGTGFLSLFVLCSTLRRTNNYPLGLEGYEVHRTRVVKSRAGSYDFWTVYVYGSWEVGYCCGFAGAERLLSRHFPLGTPGLLSLTNSLKIYRLPPRPRAKNNNQFVATRRCRL